VGVLHLLTAYNRFWMVGIPLEEAAIGSGLPVEDICGVIDAIRDADLVATDCRKDGSLSWSSFVSKLDNAIYMWKAHMGLHQLMSSLEDPAIGRRLFTGMLLEVRHYILSNTRHIATALERQSPHEPAYKHLTQYLVEESSHSQLLDQGLRSMSLTDSEIGESHPLISTISLIEYLCATARYDLLIFASCLRFIELNPDDLLFAMDHLHSVSKNAAIPSVAIDAIIEHGRRDVSGGHYSLLDSFFYISLTFHSQLRDGLLRRCMI
jgi:hypothetical protein